MSMGYGACSAYIINEDKLKELNLPSWAAFQEQLELYSLIDLQDWLECGEPYEELEDLWKSVQTEFSEVTNLNILIDYHDSEADGSCHDDVDGVFYYAEGVVSPTIAGAKALDSGLVSKGWWVVYS
jgi:hypothetical protein